MNRRKKKEPSKTMRPSRESVWKRQAGRFHLTPEEVAMAKATGFTPTLMDEVAIGKQIKRRAHDKLPTQAMPGQIKRVKRVIRERYAKKVGVKSAAAGSSSAPRPNRQPNKPPQGAPPA